MKKEYKYNLSDNDFIDFQLHYLKENSKMTSSVKTTIIILISIYIVLFTSMAFYFRESVFLIIIIAILVSAFSILQIFTYKRRLEKKIINKVREYIKEGKLNKVLGDKELKIYDEKVVFKEDRGSSTFKKDEILKIDASKKCVFLYTDNMSAIIIPKNYLNDEDIQFLLSYKNI